ncbi:MAG: HD domain-containing phosphohydrolase [Rubrobacteraceae bacterium]
MDDLAALATKRSPEDLLERTLAAAREHLGMDVAFVAEFSEDRLEFRSIEGDAQSFGLQEDSGVPLESSYCRRLVAGLIPNVIPDARSNSHVKDLEATRDAQIGAYVGVPLRFSDGRVYGTFCCVNHSPEPSLRARDAGFVKVLARLVSEQLEREELEKRNQLLETRAAGADALVAALEARDGYTGEHSMAVVELSESVARSLGFPEEEIEDLKHAALLHDVGKMGIPDSVLGKQGPLEEWEWEVMKQHPEIGERIVASLQSLEHLAPVVRAEHERWDGKGYPDSLSGTEIPLPSRIVLACDALHAMTSDRPYREAMELPEALEELKMEAGKQFDPRVVQALIAVVEN